MTTISIAPRTEIELRRLQRGLKLYALAAEKSMDEVLEKKGRDLGIQLFRGFRSRRWGGSRGGRGQGGIAWRELRARSAAGRGTRVRSLELDPRWAGAIPKFQKRRALTARAARARGLAGRAAALVPLTKWQQLVAQETAKRQAGIGALAASFLWVRRRTSQARGTYYVRNKTGRTLGYVEKGPGFFRIAGTQDGLDIIDTRYGIVAAAVAAVTADMVPYINRKLGFNLTTIAA